MNSRRSSFSSSSALAAAEKGPSGPRPNGRGSVTRVAALPALAGICAILTGCILLPGCGGVAAAPEPAKVSTAKARSDGRVVVPPNSPKLAQIMVATVSTGQFVLAEVTAPGEVQGNPNRISHVLTPVTGLVKEVLVHLGDTVKEGQALAIIESPDATAAVVAHMQAQAQIRQANSSLLKAQRDLERVRELNERGAVALKEVHAAENDAVQAQASLDQAQATEKSAAQRLKTLGLEAGQLSPLVHVRAPIGGKVMEIAVAPGEYRDDLTASMMTITELHTVWMCALVPESKIHHVQVGEPVHAEFAAYPGEVFRARVMRISDTVDPQTRTIKVDAEIPNPAGRLRLGMFGQFHHLHDPVEKPAVPVSAVIETNGRTVVYVEESPGVFRERTITKGERKDGLLPVLSGLVAGERIVVDGVMLLHTEEAAR